jgi:hypothetical protein
MNALECTESGARFSGKGNQAVAKKVLPIHIDDREREILRRLSERDGCSMAEIVRRSIRSMAIGVIDKTAPPVESPAAQ